MSRAKSKDDEFLAICRLSFGYAATQPTRCKSELLNTFSNSNELKTDENHLLVIYDRDSHLRKYLENDDNKDVITKFYNKIEKTTLLLQ